MEFRAKLIHNGIIETRKLLESVSCFLEGRVGELVENIETIEDDVGANAPPEFQSLLGRYRTAVETLHEAQTVTRNTLAKTAGDNVIEDT